MVRISSLLVGTLSVSFAACSSAGDAASVAPSTGAEGDGDVAGAMPELPVLGGDPSVGAGGAAAEEDSGPCLTLALWGATGRNIGSAATQPDPLAEWFDESTTATARSLQEQPEAMAAALEGIDAVVLRDLRAWELDDTQATTIQAWVEGGGAVMALSGFSGDGTDVRTTNDLLSFSQMHFASVNSLDTALGIGPCGYCLGTTSQQGGFAPEHPIARQLERVGAFQGRSIEGDGQPLAFEDNLVLGMTNTIGQGRVFLFHDDWVGQADQWATAPQVDCSSNVDCAQVSIASTYQMHQFWYNAVRWLVPEGECFEVQDANVQSW